MIEIEEERDNFKPVVLPIEKLGRLSLQLDKYRPKLTVGQYRQCLSIWKYDPPAAVRYCKAVTSHVKRAAFHCDK